MLRSNPSGNYVKYILLLAAFFCVQICFANPIVKQLCYVEEIKDKLALELRNFLNESRYDSTVYAAEYLEKYQNSPDVDLRTLRFNSLYLWDKYGASSCVGVAEALKRNLAQYLTFQVVPVRFHSLGESPTHVALVAQCEDGLILLDPATGIPSPVVLKDDQETVSLDSGRLGNYTFSLNRENTEISLRRSPTDQYPSVSPSQVTYFLEGLEDPDNKVIMPRLATIKKLNITNILNPFEIWHNVIFDLESKLIRFVDIQPSTQEDLRLEISFEEYLSNPQSALDLLEDEFVVGLKMTRSDILNRIDAVVKASKLKLETY